MSKEVVEREAAPPIGDSRNDGLQDKNFREQSGNPRPAKWSSPPLEKVERIIKGAVRDSVKPPPPAQPKP